MCPTYRPPGLSLQELFLVPPPQEAVPPKKTGFAFLQPSLIGLSNGGTAGMGQPETKEIRQ